MVTLYAGYCGSGVAAVSDCERGPETWNKADRPINGPEGTLIARMSSSFARMRITPEA